MVAEVTLETVEILWKDSLSYVTCWTQPKNLDWDDIELSLLHRTVGYVLRETDDYIAVVQNHTADNWKDGLPENIDMGMLIPKCAIVSRTTISEAVK